MTADGSGLGRLITSGRAAIARAGQVESSFRLAGRTIRLLGAGPALIHKISPAFSHLPEASDDAEADLTVLLWDGRSTGEPLPDLGTFSPTPGSPVTPILHGSDESFVFHSFENAMSYLDRATGVAAYVVEDAAALPPWERACPLRALLTWWLSSQSLLLAHGAAVGSPNGAILLAGPGGSGKSTTALACLASGMGYLGDDYVLLETQHHRVWSVYGSAKLAEDHLTRFPHLLQPEAQLPADPQDAKRIGWPATIRPETMVISAPVSAIVVPVVTGGTSCALTPVPSSRALMAVAPLTMFQTPGDQRAAFRLSTRVVAGLPAFRLELGQGMERVPHLIQELINTTEQP